MLLLLVLVHNETVWEIKHEVLFAPKISTLLEFNSVGFQTQRYKGRENRGVEGLHW